MTTPISATSSGGSSIAAGIRKTHEVWKDESFAVRTVYVWLAAAPAARIPNVAQPVVCAFRRRMKGTAAASAATATTDP